MVIFFRFVHESTSKPRALLLMPLHHEKSTSSSFSLQNSSYQAPKITCDRQMLLYSASDQQRAPTSGSASNSCNVVWNLYAYLARNEMKSNVLSQAIAEELAYMSPQGLSL